VFDSGAKSSEEQPRYDLIPYVAQRREAQRWQQGAAFHGENNWQRGRHDTAFRRDRLNHLVEHLNKWINGDRSDDHLAAIRCNAAMLIWFEEMDGQAEP
jgi:hypothetical protein